jgi:hypothetical protein
MILQQASACAWRFSVSDTDPTTLPKPRSGAYGVTGRPRGPKPVEPITGLPDGDEAWPVSLLAGYTQQSEKSFRKNFARTGKVPLTRIAGQDFGSLNKLKRALADMLDGPQPQPKRPQARRRR